ncbi:MAG: RHS repeat-associated core domain-containing protein, partial [Planctomycetes bacterium]|nr:RHS repeat-associated core domain-containing protein [Planctomycetota bacterium]
GGLLAQVDEDGHVGAYLYDGNGNVGQVLAAEGGGLEQSNEFDPFGVRLEASTGEGSFGFSTIYLDVETGQLAYMRRGYEPATGRWMARDPIEEVGGFGLYAFVGNSPTGAVDVLGQMPLFVEEALARIQDIGRQLRRNVSQASTIGIQAALAKLEAKLRAKQRSSAKEYSVQPLRVAVKLPVPFGDIEFYGAIRGKAPIRDNGICFPLDGEIVVGGRYKSIPIGWGLVRYVFAVEAAGKVHVEDKNSYIEIDNGKFKVVPLAGRIEVKAPELSVFTFSAFAEVGGAISWDLSRHQGVTNLANPAGDIYFRGVAEYGIGLGPGKIVQRHQFSVATGKDVAPL